MNQMYVLQRKYCMSVFGSSIFLGSHCSPRGEARTSNHICTRRDTHPTTSRRTLQQLCRNTPTALRRYHSGQEQESPFLIKRALSKIQAHNICRHFTSFPPSSIHRTIDQFYSASESDRYLGGCINPGFFMRSRILFSQLGSRC